MKNTQDRILLHPGAPKCATTFIQEQVFSSLKNISCLGRPFHETLEFENFLSALIYGETEQEIKSAYGELLKLNDTRNDKAIVTVLSDENMFSANSHRMIARRIMSCCDNVDVVLTVRDQRTAVQSMYQGHAYQLKEVPEPYNGRHTSFFNWMMCITKHGLPAFDYWKAYKGYVDVLGPDRVHVIPMELLLDDREAYIRKLVGIMGVDAPTDMILSDSKSNVSQSSRLFLYNKIRSRFFSGRNLTAYLPFGKKVRQIFNTYLSSGVTKKPELTFENLKWIADYYGEGNALLAQATGDPYIEKYLKK